MTPQALFCIPFLCVLLIFNVHAIDAENDEDDDDDWLELEENGQCFEETRNILDCRDELPQCPELADLGFCAGNTDYNLNVKTKCRKSCPNVCDKGIFHWGETQIVEDDGTLQVVVETLQYLYNVVYADYTYEKVRSECQNMEESCAYWASLGECEENPQYMHYECAPSCQTCDLLDEDLRCPWDPTAPRSLEHGDLNKLFQRIAESDEYNPTVLSRPDKDDERPWVVQFENFVTQQECDEIIKIAHELGYERSEGTIEHESGEVEWEVSDYRTSFAAWCEDDCIAQKVPQQVAQRIANLTGISQQHYEHFQLLRYYESQYYKVHGDFIDSYVNKVMGPRVLTLFIYLNDVEEGGETHFPNLGIKVAPRRGRAVLWPSAFNNDLYHEDHRTDHEALPVIKGIKYGCNAWLHVGNAHQGHLDGCM